MHTAVDVRACRTVLRWYDCSIASDHVWVWQCGIDTGVVAGVTYARFEICSIYIYIGDWCDSTQADWCDSTSRSGGNE